MRGCGESLASVVSFTQGRWNERKAMLIRWFLLAHKITYDHTSLTMDFEIAVYQYKSLMMMTCARHALRGRRGPIHRHVCNTQRKKIMEA